MGGGGVLNEGTKYRLTKTAHAHWNASSRDSQKGAPSFRKQAIEVPFLHIADATATAIKEQGCKRPALMGTMYLTMIKQQKLGFTGFSV